MNVNFNEMFETLTFQQSCAQYLYSIHIYKQVLKGAGSSSENYFQFSHKRLNYKLLSFCCMLHLFILHQTIPIGRPLQGRSQKKLITEAMSMEDL